MKHAKNIPGFRGVYMRDNLPKKPFKNECGIINLDSNANSGTHWTAYSKKDNKTIYYNSFGNLKPPREFIEYIGDSKNIFFNFDNHQKYNTIICGHLCLEFLYKNSM